MAFSDDDIYDSPIRYNEGKVDWTLIPWDNSQFWDLQEEYRNMSISSLENGNRLILNYLLEKNIEKVLLVSLITVQRDFPIRDTPWEALEDVCRVFQFGVGKYGRENYQIAPGLPLESYIQSMWRHLVEYLKGNLMDNESLLLHFSHIAANCFMYLWTEKTYHESL